MREYTPRIWGMPSLALQALLVAHPGVTPQGADAPFLLRYYGPHRRDDGSFTFRYISAARVVLAGIDVRDNGKTTEDFGFDPNLFKGKVVLVGPVAGALHDLKATPVGGQFPGVEVHATAYANLRERQRVWPLGTASRMGITLAASLMVSVGIILSRHTLVKLLVAAAVLGLLAAEAVILFRGHTIYWLPLAGPLLALLLATIGAFAWSYLTEGRQRRFFFRALSQYLSPDVAAEVERTGALSLSGERRELTVMFSDIAGFTTLSETLEERITEVLNFYLGEMSAIVYGTSGTLDKYIGDAIMAFWNAPVLQADHAVRACRTALGMKRREAEIQPQLARLGATGMYTRIGIHTGRMTFGNMGSAQKFNYTVIGDAVNFCSRLEGANKLYGSEVLVSETTADLVRGAFVVRRLDLLRVQGKTRPMAVYELMAEGAPDEPLRLRVERYERALSLYQKQQWDDAKAVLAELIRQFPEDAPAAKLMHRIDDLRADPPPPGWDGVYAAKGK